MNEYTVIRTWSRININETIRIMNVYVEHYKTTAFYKYEIGLLVGWHSLMKEKDKKALYMYE